MSEHRRWQAEKYRAQAVYSQLLLKPQLSPAEKELFAKISQRLSFIQQRMSRVQQFEMTPTLIRLTSKNQTLQSQL